MKVIKGNLLDAAERGDVNTIMHGCNCFHAMYSGIAGEISRRYPNVPQTDRDYMRSGSTAKLGDYSLAHVTSRQERKVGEKYPGGVGLVDVEISNSFNVINLYTQYSPGADFLPSVFPEGLRRVAEDFKGHTIGVPLIGCGIGGGDWEYVMNQLLAVEPDVRWEVYVL